MDFILNDEDESNEEVFVLKKKTPNSDLRPKFLSQNERIEIQKKIEEQMIEEKKQKELKVLQNRKEYRNYKFEEPFSNTNINKYNNNNNNSNNRSGNNGNSRDNHNHNNHNNYSNQSNSNDKYKRFNSSLSNRDR